MRKNCSTRILAMLVVVFGLFAFAGDARSEECLSYEPAKVKITGTIVRETFPGPPNYESIKGGDEIETFCILKPGKPVCVNGKEGDDLDISETNVKALHMVFMESDCYRYRSLWYKKVSVSGMLYHGFNAHHRSRVLLKVIGIKPAK